MNSALYLGTTFHKRYGPKEHKFVYDTFQVLLNLDEVDDLTKSNFIFKYNQSGLLSFKDSDHMLTEAQSLKCEITNVVKEEHPSFKINSISILTHLRTLGFLFNPVCFYFIEDDKDQYCIVVEVMNTYHEIKRYVSKIYKKGNDGFNVREKFDKGFYISPYSSSKGEIEYIIKMKNSSELLVQVFNYEDSKKTVYANFQGRLTNLNNKNLLKTMFSYPLITMMVWLRIHIQAGVLYLMGLKYFKKIEEINEQTNYVQWRKK